MIVAMEALLLLLGELAAALLLPTILAIFEGLVFLVAATIELIGWRRRRRATRRGEAAPPPRVPGWARTALRVALVVALIGVVVVAVLDAFFFEPVARSVITRVAGRAGIGIEVGSVDGSLWTLRASMRDVRALRNGHPQSDFVLSADRVEVDVRALALLWLQVRIESITAHGVSGLFVRTGVADRTRPRRAFAVDRLEATAVDVRVDDQTRERPVTARVELDRFVAEPFRSRTALFDVLFRADVDGRIDGRRLSIARRSDALAASRWFVDALPIALVAPYLPGPLGWLDGGTATIDVAGGTADGAALELRADAVFRDVSITVPADLSLTKRVLAKPVVAYIERRARDLPLSFAMHLDRDVVEVSASPEAAGLVAAFGAGLKAAVAAESKIAEAVFDRLDRSR